MHDHGNLRDIFFGYRQLDTQGKNIVKLLAISQTRQLQLFLTDLPPNFWKITRLLGKVKNTVSIRFISLPHPGKNRPLRGHVLYYPQ